MVSEATGKKKKKKKQKAKTKTEDVRIRGLFFIVRLRGMRDTSNKWAMIIKGRQHDAFFFLKNVNSASSLYEQRHVRHDITCHNSDNTNARESWVPGLLVLA